MTWVLPPRAPLRVSCPAAPQAATLSLKLIMQSISPHESMARLFGLLKAPGAAPGAQNWKLMQAGEVPQTIMETRE
jgi:hypothetical protein